MERTFWSGTPDPDVGQRTAVRHVHRHLAGLADRFRKPEGATESESGGVATTRTDCYLLIDEEDNDGSVGDSELAAELADNYMEPM